LTPPLKKRPDHEKKKRNIRGEEKEGRRSKKENCQAKLQEVVIPLPGRRVVPPLKFEKEVHPGAT